MHIRVWQDVLFEKLCNDLQVRLAEMESYNAPGSAFPRRFYVGQLLPFLQNHMPISAGVDQTQVNVAKLRIQVSQEDLDYFKH